MRIYNPKSIASSGAELAVVSFIKEKFTNAHISVVFSMPSSLFVSEVAPDLALKILPAWILAYNSSANAGAHIEPRTHTFFRVLASEPERRGSLMPSHTDLRRSCCKVSVLQFLGYVHDTVSPHASLGITLINVLTF